jgi:hypothetical protein
MTNELIPYHEQVTKAGRTIKPALDVNRLVKIANAKNSALDVQYTRNISEPLTQQQLYFSGGVGAAVGTIAGAIATAVAWGAGEPFQVAAFGALVGLFTGLPAMAWVVGRELSGNASNEAVSVSSVTAEALQLALAEAGQGAADDTAVSGARSWFTLPLDVQARPHILIVGSTGAGKSVTLNAVAEKLSSQYPAAQWLICDYGGAEWKESQAKTANAIAETLIQLSELVQERLEVYAGRVNESERLFVILEEFESALDDLKLLDRQLGKAALIAARDVARRGRKVGIHLIVVVQSGKADTLDTSIRNNLDMRLVMRSPATVQRSLEVTADMTQAARGEAWCNEVDAVVKVPYTQQPNLPLYAPRIGSEGGSGGGMVQSTSSDAEPLGTAFFSRVEPSEPVPDLDILEAIARMDSVPDNDTLSLMVAGVKRGDSANKIYSEVGGTRSEVLAQIRVLKETLGQ